MEKEEQGNEGNEQDDEEYMPNDDEVDDFVLDIYVKYSCT
jgi:hypothetical protein